MRSIMTILAIWAAGLGAAAQFGKISILFTDLEAHYAGAGAVGIGLMVSVVGMVGLVFGTTAGLAVARVGPRRAVLWALALGAVVSVVQAVLPPYPIMMASRVLEGVSHLAIVVVGPTSIASVAPRHLQGAAMTLWSSFFGLTYAVLAWFGPGVVALWGDAGLFLGHAGWMALCFAALWVLMPRDVAVTAARSGQGILAQHWAIYASPWLGAPAMGFLCYTVTYVAVLTLLPAVVTPGWGGFIAVAMPLVSIGVSLTLGVWLLSRVTAVALVQGGFGFGIASALGLWLFWGTGLAEAVFALGLAGAVGIVQGASFAALAQLNPAPEDRARASGAIAQLGNLGTTTGTPLLALILTGAGATGLMLFLVGFFVLGIAIHSLQARRRARAG
jgi:DHA1 family inner membrane transport protein